jgi:hypothetical protein
MIVAGSNRETFAMAQTPMSDLKMARGRMVEATVSGKKFRCRANEYVRAARKTWRRAIWVIGDGPYASVSRCPPGATVMLFGTMAEAEVVTGFIDSTGCGENCRRDHLTVELKIKRRPSANCKS